MEQAQYVLMNRGIVLTSHGTFSSLEEALEYAYLCLPRGIADKVHVAVL